MNNDQLIELNVSCDPALARLVRMTAANVAALGKMSVERVEDIRMAAEEAFVYCCSATGDGTVNVAFSVSEEQVGMKFSVGGASALPTEDDDPTAAYNDLILGAVCDSYIKSDAPAVLELQLKAEA